MRPWRLSRSHQRAPEVPSTTSGGQRSATGFREDSMRFLAGARTGIGMALALADPAAAAEPYPSRNVRLIVPYPPGGNVDSAARIVADKLQEKLGKPFIIENKAGAGGLIAGEAFAKSENDGYTLLVGANGPVLFAP